MHPDVTEFRDFYGSPLGQVVRRILASRIRARWRDVRGHAVIGLGYATPYLRMFNGEAALVAALMPQEQGAAGWPVDGPRRSALVSEMHLPLPDISVERLLLIHSLESCEQARALLREIWRVLTPEGRLLVIAPNRRGLWARMDNTPFGHGQPYSRGQLERLLSRALFTPMHWAPCLFMPPTNWGPVLHAGTAWERIGSWGWPAFAGVLMVEAQKQVYAGIPELAAGKAATGKVMAGKVMAKLRPVTCASGA